MTRPDFQRFAVYHAPPLGALSDRAAGWLGWDAARGEEPAPFVPDGLPLPAEELTARPRKYGFHATLRAPFRLRADLGFADLDSALERLADRIEPVTLDGLAVAALGSFIALVPRGDTALLAAFAAQVVTGTNDLRAPLTDDDIARRRPERLSAGQRSNLERWGYPFVLDAFRFHMTLTGPVEDRLRGPVTEALGAAFDPVLPRPYVIDELCLFGERGDGHFVLVKRYALSSRSS